MVFMYCLPNDKYYTVDHLAFSSSNQIRVQKAWNSPSRDQKMKSFCGFSWRTEKVRRERVVVVTQ